MPSADYFRRQADICVRLSLATSDPEISSRLVMMAEEYKLRAAEAEAQSPPTEPSDLIARPKSQAGTAVVQQQQQQQQPSAGPTDNAKSAER
jgi:hypothetical protein